MTPWCSSAASTGSRSAALRSGPYAAAERLITWKEPAGNEIASTLDGLGNIEVVGAFERDAGERSAGSILMIRLTG